MSNIVVIVTMALSLTLILVNFYYSSQAKKMLEAKLEETKTELVMASRPLLVIRAVVHEQATTYEADVVSAPRGAQTSDDRPLTSHFSHFELFNAGNSPAIGLEISLMDADKAVVQSETLGFLRNNEQALTFVPIKLEPQKSYCLACEYESIRGRVKKIWYQTWLPFTTMKGAAPGLINVNVGELEFKEVAITDRINALNSRDKTR